MGLLLVVTGLVFVALPGLARGAGRRLQPDEWAHLCVWGLAVGAVVLELAAGLYALPTVFRAAGVPVLADMCERTLRLFLPGGASAGWAAAAAAVTMPVLAAIGVRRARRTYRIVRTEPWLGEHSDVGDHELVVLPSDQLMAVSVDGEVPQVIVSQGLLDMLPDREVQLVLRHESAHLENNHQRLLLLATAVEHALAFFPPVRTSALALRTALERWADEVAAGDVVEDRARLAAALLDMSSALTAHDLAAFSPADTVLERLDALSRPPVCGGPFDRLAVYLPGVVVGTGVVVAIGVWAEQARTVLAMAGRCPT